VPIDADQQTHNFNSLTIRALPEIGFLAVESRGDGVFQQYLPFFLGHSAFTFGTALPAPNRPSTFGDACALDPSTNPP
jgi:hypothetical protein